MTEVLYYTGDTPVFQYDVVNPFTGPAASGLMEALDQQYIENFVGSKTLRFLIGVGGQVVLQEVVLQFEGGAVTVGGVGGAAFQAVATGAITLAAAAFLGLTGGEVVLAAIIIDVVATPIFSTITTTASSWYEEWTGTVDVNVQLKDSSGNVLGGGLYKDGLGTVTELEAVQALIRQSIDNTDMPDAAGGMTVDIVTAGSPLPPQTYNIESGDILQKIADFANVSLQIVKDYTDPLPGSYGNNTNGEIVFDYGGHNFLISGDNARLFL